MAYISTQCHMGIYFAFKRVIYERDKKVNHSDHLLISPNTEKQRETHNLSTILIITDGSWTVVSSQEPDAPKPITCAPLLVRLFILLS
jgi:hypothetical protein